jgi:hypothetical protein
MIDQCQIIKTNYKNVTMVLEFSMQINCCCNEKIAELRNLLQYPWRQQWKLQMATTIIFWNFLKPLIYQYIILFSQNITIKHLLITVSIQNTQGYKDLRNFSFSLVFSLLFGGSWTITFYNFFFKFLISFLCAVVLPFQIKVCSEYLEITVLKIDSRGFTNKNRKNTLLALLNWSHVIMFPQISHKLSKKQATEIL